MPERFTGHPVVTRGIHQTGFLWDATKNSHKREDFMFMWAQASGQIRSSWDKKDH